MIVLDTNVVSELMRSTPNDSVLAWADAQIPTSLCITSITQAEILYGVLLLPKGKRRDAISKAAQEMFDDLFEGRILGFDGEAAIQYATVSATRRHAGRPLSAFDAQIAAITRIHDAKLATRNVADFQGCGIELINPWG